MTELEKSMLRDALVQLAVQKFIKTSLDPATEPGADKLLDLIRRHANIYANLIKLIG